MKITEIPNDPSQPRVCPECLSGGGIALYRNPAGKPFTEEDAYCFRSRWSNFSDIRDAFLRISAAEQSQAKKHPFAWSSEFGYLSPNPFHCGEGLVICALVHLEGLHLIGDIPQVLNAFEGARIDYECFGDSEFRTPAHLFSIANFTSLGITSEKLIDRFTKFLNHLIVQEMAARESLAGENVRILADSVCRSLAVLKSARLLDHIELLDILSPLRLAAFLRILNGISEPEIWEMMKNVLDHPELRARDSRDCDPSDSPDAALADSINERFSTVTINSRGKRLFS